MLLPRFVVRGDCSIVSAAVSTDFHYVQEWDDEFLALFPHRFDYIWAECPNPGATVEWKTESRHPLSDRLIRQGSYLYGVRFGAETNYCLLDIDTGSAYHPRQDPFAISRIAGALEPLGLVSYIICTSSYSGGLHLYFPFQQAQSSWQLAIALACLLENAGFKLQPGQLEVFPNPKPYATDGNLSLFNAHRLPLQIGSYLLNKAYQPGWSDAGTFVRQWQLVQQSNDIDSKILKQIIKQAKRKHFGISGKAEKFINDLNAEIELGWTGYGQTNRLLGRITMRAYIFHHILSGGQPLQGEALVNEVVETARSLPGYQEWCRHQHEIEHRAEEWARCIENSHYFHFGDQGQKPKPETQDPVLADAIDHSPSWNQRQSAATRERIRSAIADLLEQNSLPIKPTARFQALLKYSIGGASLYRHRDLWHPNYLRVDSDPIDSNRDFTNQTSTDEVESYDSPVENPPHPPIIKTDSQLACVEDASNWLNPPSLLAIKGGDKPVGNAFDDLAVCDRATTASNLSPNLDAHHPVVPIHFLHATNQDPPAFGIPFINRGRGDRCKESGANISHIGMTSSLPGVQYVHQVLSTIKATQKSVQETARLAQIQQQYSRTEAAQQRHSERRQQFLESGDPILVAEAMAWVQADPQ